MIAGIAIGRHILPTVNAKRNNISKAESPVQVHAPVNREIRLSPSKSDYETFAKTTALAMGRPARSASKPKPNTRLLSLLNLGA